MIRSMTGFGKGEGGGFVVEMRSVNHKFLDVSLKLPKSILPLEGRVKKAVGERFSRGRIDVFLTRGGGEEVAHGLKLDLDAAKQYIALLSELKNMFDLPGAVDLKLLASFKDVITEEEVTEDTEAIWAALAEPLRISMDALDGMRSEEGGTLAADIRERAAAIGYSLNGVEGRAPLVIQEYAAKLGERVEKLTSGAGLDKDRLIQEVAVFADRCDITEEIVRARSHLGQLEKMLSEGGPVGRKMDFLLQEINREINTIGSKASDYEIAKRVVEMKGELEKIREQAQNIE